MGNFFLELKRRNVYKVALVYARRLVAANRSCVDCVADVRRA